MPSRPIFYPLPFSALFLCSHSELCKFPSNQFIERSCTMHCTVNQKENRKLRRRKVKKLSTVCWFAVHCPAPNLFLALEGSRMEDGGWMEESPKKRLIYRPLAIAPHYFQRPPLFAHYHILLTFDTHSMASVTYFRSSMKNTSQNLKKQYI